jgi:uncharacterized damage-inducible protein DinB
MKDMERFQKLFRDHYDGDPWIEINLRGTLDGVSAKAAAKNIGSLNSIWQIVNHVIHWRETLLKRMKGQSAPTPANNFFEPVTDISEQAWTETLNRLQSSQEALLEYLAANEEADPDEKPPGQQYNRYELIEGMLQHDVYHLGQVVLIKKMTGILD